LRKKYLGRDSKLFQRWEKYSAKTKYCQQLKFIRVNFVHRIILELRDLCLQIVARKRNRGFTVCGGRYPQLFGILNLNDAIHNLSAMIYRELAHTSFISILIRYRTSSNVQSLFFKGIAKTDADMHKHC